ncbi:MAG: hypothetical protein ABWX92_14685 [Mycetocola sp.]
MARERASFNIDIWSDADFRDLTGPAQGLYFKLTSHPKLDYCGVTEFHPGRLAAFTREESVQSIMIAAAELSYKFFCVFDQDTEEVLVRSFLRHDGLLKQPRLAVSAAKAYGSVASNKIRAVIVHELQRYKRENGDLAAWEKPQMKTILKQPAMNVRETDVEMSMPTGVVLFGQPHNQLDGLGYGQRSDETLGKPTGSATTSTSTSTATTPSSKEDAARSDGSYPQAAFGGRGSSIVSDSRLVVS